MRLVLLHLVLPRVDLSIAPSGISKKCNEKVLLSTLRSHEDGCAEGVAANEVSVLHTGYMLSVSLCMMA